jgi:hypothetical protein
MKMTREKCLRIIERMVSDLQTKEAPVPCRELYVFGSFSRGATRCGDLDVVLVHDEVPSLKPYEHEYDDDFGEKSLARFKLAMMDVIRRPSDRIDVVLGTSLQEALRDTKIKPLRCKLVWRWHDDGEQWRDRLAAIAANPHTGSYRKKLLDRTRFICPLRQLAELQAHLRAGTLTVKRIPIESIDPVLHPIWEHWYGIEMEDVRRGRQSRELLRYVFWWMQQHAPLPKSKRHDDLRVTVRNHSMWSDDYRFNVTFGRPRISAALWLVGKPKDVKVCLIPHLKKRDANELLEFSPGASTGAKARKGRRK